MQTKWVGWLVGFMLTTAGAGCDDEGGAQGGEGGERATGGDGGAGGGAGGAPCTQVAASKETVILENQYGTLEGTLLLPESCGPAPVAVILSGSGSGLRDGGTPRSYRLLAEALLAQGIGSLRYDDHGVGGSVTAAPGAVEDFTFDLEVADAAGWVTQLRTDERVGDIVFAGHSQGSLTAILASRLASVDGLVSLAGAGRPAGQLLREQLADQLTTEQLAELEAALLKLEAGELAGALTPPLNQILPEDVQPYLISWLTFDPQVEIATVEAPTLLVQGEVDIQVSVADAELLHEGLPSAELVLIADMCHALKTSTAAPVSQKKCYQDSSIPLAEDLVPAIASFVSKLP